MIRPISFASFDAVLTKLNAKLDAREVHALYLGALTSPNPQLGPQRLLDRIFGDNPVLGDSLEDANAALQILFGYWNTLIAERDRGGVVRLARRELREKPTREELRAFAKRRQGEILWFIRGIDAGGGDPIQFGPEGKKLLAGIAEGSGFLHTYDELLGRDKDVDAKELKKSRASLLGLVATIERLMADLMTVSAAIRREMVAFAADMDERTEVGGRTERSAKVGRNATCPCGSGRKYKKCCGGVSTVQ
jgi:uncharacterized protein